MRYTIGLLVIFTSALPAGIEAQDSSLNLFMYERSYVAPRVTPTVLGAPDYYLPEPDLLAEAQFASPFVLYRGLNEQMVREGDSQGMRFNLFLLPQFRLRGLDVPSGPVRSISFMPKFTGQLLWASRPPAADFSTGGRRYWGFNVVLGHHSNGGDGCVFADESGAECESSLPLGTNPDEREVRTEGGNFSTNYVELGVFRRWGAVHDMGDLNGAAAVHWLWSVDVGVSIQRHHDWFGFPLPGGAKEAFGDIYGVWRPRLDVAGNYTIHGGPRPLRGKIVRLWFSYERIDPPFERFPGARDYRIESELFIQWAGTPQGNRLGMILGVGIRYVRGQDYYNTQFIRDINLFQIALMVDPWSLWLQR